MVLSVIEEATRAERLGRFDEARQILRESLAASQPSATLAERLMLAELCVVGGRQFHQEAETLLASAEQLAAAGDDRYLATALHLRGLLERRQGNRQEAQRWLARSPARSGGPTPERSQYLHYCGLLASDRGDTQAAQELFFNAFECATQCGHQIGQAEICDSLAGLLLKLGKTKTALSFCEKSLAIKQASSDRYGTAITLGTMGRILVAQAKYAEAAVAFQADLEIARELEDTSGIAIMLNSLASLARLQGDGQQAERLYRESASENTSPINQIHLLIGLGWLQLDRGDLEAVEASIAEAQQHLEQMPSLEELAAIVDGLRGAVAWRRGKYQAAQNLLESTNATLVTQQHALDTIPFLYELRDLHSAQGKMSDAVAVMSKALDLLSESGAARGVDDVEAWLRNVDHPRLTRVAIERHLPAPLVDQILSGELTMPKPKKQGLTILFSDLRGFTTMSESSEPEDVVELLNEWFSEATRAIQRHGGIVDKFIGDAVMALFGIPEPTEESGASAVRAALEMRASLSAMNRRNRVLGGHQLQIGIGIASGDAVVGFMGSHLRHSFTAIGDAVNTASRLESATRDYPDCDILIDQTTQLMQQAHDVAIVEALGDAALKGKQNKVALYQVLSNSESA